MGALRRSSGLVTAVALLILLPMFGVGCDKRVGEVKQAMESLKAAVEARNGQQVVTMYTQSTIDHYGELIRLAREGKRDQILKRTLKDRELILYLRGHFTATEMRGLDGKGCIKLMVDRGVWGIDTGAEDYGSIKVSGNTAWLTFQMPDDEVGDGFGSRRRRNIAKTYSVRFVLENEAWKMDETSLFELWNDMLQRDIKESGMPAEDYIREAASFGLDEELPKSIWDAPRK